jgi:copper chaperone NosL
MLVSSDRGGGQILAANEDPRFYDDIACLAADWSAEQRAGALAYVRVSNDAWLEVSRAWYARPGSLRTPMGSSLAAFATEAEARQADENGHALRWDEVVRLQRGRS